MPEIIIKLEKKDIVTSSLGNNIMIKNPNTNISIVFSQDALDELISDYKKIKKTKK